MAKRLDTRELERFCNVINKSISEMEKVGTISKAGCYAYVSDYSGAVVVDCADSYDVQFVEEMLKALLKVNSKYEGFEFFRDGEYKLVMEQTDDLEEDFEIDGLDIIEMPEEEIQVGEEKSPLLFAMEKAHADGTLADFIMDYVAFDGTIDDLKAVITPDSYLTTDDINAAYDNVEDSGLMLKDSDFCDCDPYQEFVNIVLENKIFSDKEIKDSVFDSYIEHIGEYKWDEAYVRFLDNFETIMRDELKVRVEKAHSGCGITESLTEATLGDIGIAKDNLSTVGEMMAGFIDNMPDDQINKEIRLFNRYARLLNCPHYEDMIVFVDEDYIFIPENRTNTFGEIIDIPNSDITATYYKDLNVVSEQNKVAGNYFLFFKDLDSALGYLDNSVDADEPEIDFEVDGDREITNIQEALNFIDVKTNNKFDLVNKYLSEDLSGDQVATLKTLLKEGSEAEDIAKVFTYNEDEDLSDKPYDWVTANGTAEANNENVVICKEALNILDLIRSDVFSIQKANSAYEEATRLKTGIIESITNLLELIEDLNVGE